jgi:hypothetical protein
MTKRYSEDREIEFVCNDQCADSPTWIVEGRFNAEGRFEPYAYSDLECPECAGISDPTDTEIEVA